MRNLSMHKAKPQLPLPRNDLTPWQPQQDGESFLGDYFSTIALLHTLPVEGNDAG
jgi:hypothetical protein